MAIQSQKLRRLSELQIDAILKWCSKKRHQCCSFTLERAAAEQLYHQIVLTLCCTAMWMPSSPSGRFDWKIEIQSESLIPGSL